MRIWIALAAVLAAGGPGSAASPLGNPENGRTLAETWCASCHLVSAEQKSTTTEAPPFASISRRSASELDRLPAFLAAPHPPMPAISLSGTEIRDLVAYVTSLKTS
jgi:mono/diheme cytochrome c family protein